MLSVELIKSADRVINVKGKVFYNDRRHRINIKRPVLDLFEDFPEVFYIMELCLNREKAIQRINQLTEKNVLPIILYFTSGGDGSDK